MFFPLLEQAVLFRLLARSIFYDTQLNCWCSPSHWTGGPNDSNHGVTRRGTVVPDIVSGTDVPGHEDGRGPEIPVLNGVRIIFWRDNLVYFLTCHFGKSENQWFYHQKDILWSCLPHNECWISVTRFSQWLFSYQLCQQNSLDLLLSILPALTTLNYQDVISEITETAAGSLANSSFRSLLAVLSAVSWLK